MVYINDEHLSIYDHIEYLGTVLDGKNINDGTKHTETRNRAAQKAFYGLQGAGLHYNGVSPKILLHIYEAAVKLVLLYGCSSVNVSNFNLKKWIRPRQSSLNLYLV